MKTREAAVAGLFYPADEVSLRHEIDGFLAAAPGGSAPKAMIGPHAGTKYSGPIAASAYALLDDRIERVVLLGPSHRVALRGVATSSASKFRTPLGDVDVDVDAVAAAERAFDWVRPVDEAHRREHSLELHLPFLQAVLGQFQIVPMVVGTIGADEAALLTEHLWGGPETLVVVSSDLSHFHDYATAQRLDRQTSDAIERLSCGELDRDGACGFYPLRGLLSYAQRRGMTARTLDLRNSGDTAGSRDEVVGYGSYVIN